MNRPSKKYPSIPFQYHRWSRYPSAKNAGYEIADYLIGQELISVIKPKTIINNCIVLILNLYYAYTLDPKLWVGVSLDKNSFPPKKVPAWLKSSATTAQLTQAQNRYNKMGITAALGEIVNTLHTLGYIELIEGFKDKDTGYGANTKIRARTPLTKLFHKHDFHPLIHHVSDDIETIILKDDTKDKNRVEHWIDIPFTNTARDQLRRYRHCLEANFIDINIPGDTKGHDMVYNCDDKIVKRVWNNLRWDNGGRFYMDLQNVPRKMRSKIVFHDFQNNCLVDAVEVDYSCLHIVLLMALEGVDYQEDAYYLPHPPTIDSKLFRNYLKKILLISINSKDRKSAIRGCIGEMNRDRGSYPAYFVRSKYIEKYLDKLIDKHKIISKYICSGMGVKLFTWDSMISSTVIEHFINKNIPIICVHDSYIVPDNNYESELIQVMKDAFKQSLLDFPGVKCQTATPRLDVKYSTNIEYDDKLIDRYNEWKKLLIISQADSTVGNPRQQNILKYKAKDYW